MWGITEENLKLRHLSLDMRKLYQMLLSAQDVSKSISWREDYILNTRNVVTVWKKWRKLKEKKKTDKLKKKLEKGKW